MSLLHYMLGVSDGVVAHNGCCSVLFACVTIFRDVVRYKYACALLNIRHQTLFMNP